MQPLHCSWKSYVIQIVGHVGNVGHEKIFEKFLSRSFTIK